MTNDDFALLQQIVDKFDGSTPLGSDFDPLVAALSFKDCTITKENIAIAWHRWLSTHT